MSKLFALVLMFVLSSAAPATVQRWNPKAPENNQVLPGFGLANVESVLGAIGARYQRSGTAAKPSLLVTFPNRRKAVLTFGACNADRSACKSLNMQSNWMRIANSTPERTAAAVQRFNQRYSFGKAYVSADGRPGMQRYLTADYGYIRGNLAVNLLVFANQVDRFARDVLQPLEARR
ncbi:MAG TPA: YbjN domain-containing protein [Allosphingosinicella sp.]|nr:YbjN domain-containing protein [Allosphingosinicella sp.]